MFVKYRNVEKLFSAFDRPTANPDQPIVERFAPAFWPITLQRKMRLFKGALGLTPCMAGLPDPDFLIRLLTPYVTHQAWLREAAGADYKNLENLLQGTDTRLDTLKSLAQQLGASLESLQGLARCSRDGALVPGLLDMFRLCEGVPFWFFKMLTAHELLCPNCGANIIDDLEPWWSRQPIKQDKPEYAFAERLLMALMGGHIFLLMATAAPGGNAMEDLIRTMAAPGRHPIGNWLSVVQKTYGCKNFYDLAHQLPPADSEDDEISQPRLRKWSSGLDDLLPLQAGLRMISVLPDAKNLERGLITARVLALVEDFICSATHGTVPPSRQVVRQVIAARIEALSLKLMTSLKLQRGRRN